MDDAARPAVPDLATLADGTARLFHRRPPVTRRAPARPYDPAAKLCPARAKRHLHARRAGLRGLAKQGCGNDDLPPASLSGLSAA
jgi:hypothetical protein